MTEDRILAAALAIDDPEARNAFLDKACADQADVRAKIEEHIAQRTKTNTVPAKDPDPVNATGPAPAAQNETGPFTGAAGQQEEEWAFLAPGSTPGALGRLGHYEILGVIGRGAMGAVLKAHDEKLQRVVALKVMSPALMADPAARKRFVREARLAAAVTHDHIVAIYAVEEEGPIPYLVMPLIAGHSLQQEIDTRGPLPATEVVRIGMQIAEGLQAAHQHQLIHRDIKPANILLEDDSGRAKITDFGLARADDDASITQSGTILGTPLYMSPEQAYGKKLDLRSDLFSFGSVLYALCTGRPPFQAKGTLAVLRRVCDSEPRPVRDINPDIPTWLEKLIFKLLEKYRPDRYQTAGEVAAVLREHLTDTSQPAEPDPLPPKKAAAPPTEKLKRQARQETLIAPPAARPSRKKRLIIAGLLGLAGLLVVGTLAAWIVSRATRGPGGAPIVKGDAAGQPEPGKGMPARLVGSWKGRRITADQELDLVHIFSKDGEFRSDAFDKQGQPRGVALGRWQCRDGEIHLSFNDGGFERATVTWIDDDTMTYRIVGQGDQGLVGVTDTLHRRVPADNPVVKDGGAGQPENGKGMPDKLVGTWKGRSSYPSYEKKPFFSEPPALDVVKTFSKDGSYRGEAFDLQGRSTGIVSTGRWQFRDGKIHTLPDTGPIRLELATATYIDNDTMIFRVLSTNPPTLAIALPTIRFRRQ